MKPTFELLIKALQTRAKAHNIEFRDFSKDPDEVPQVLLKSESVPVIADVRFLCQAFFGSSSMIEVGYGNELTLTLALPAGTKL